VGIKIEPFLVDVLEGGHLPDDVPVLLELQRDAARAVREEVLQEEQRLVRLSPLPPVERRQPEDLSDPSD
jgi:hypothetical protein